MAEFIRFEEVPNDGRKTRRWVIENKKSGAELGVIAWYGAWRQYTVDFTEGCTFSAGCLKDIQEFLTKANADHKSERDLETKRVCDNYYHAKRLMEVEP